MPWTGDVTETARTLWRDGWSGDQVADALYRRHGVAVTRAAVIGKMHRLGESQRLTKRAVAANPRRQRRTEAADPALRSGHPSTVRARASKLNAALGIAVPPIPLAPEPLPEPVAEPFIPPDERQGLLDLGPGDCRWPIGDPGTADFHFCGRPKRAAFVYCEHHARRAYPGGLKTRSAP